MDKQKKKQIRKYISWVLIVCIVALLACLPMIAGNEEAASGPQASILTAKAERRDITASVLTGGTLIAEDAVEITVPAAVKIKEYLVSNGDTVTEGQIVATVDRVSVMTAITQVQDAMKTLQQSLNDVSSDTESVRISATAGGTVKAIYGAAGESVQDVMLRDGALAVISLDDLMAVQVKRETSLSGGNTVCVTFSDGTEVEGRVESNLEGVLTVTVEDENFPIGEQVKVTTLDGDRIGSGELYVHSPWNVLSYSGTISRVRITEGETVSAGQRLFDLETDGHTAQFDALSSKHREYEELMLELFKMYQSETINAPADGMITGVDEDGAYMLSGSGDNYRITFLANGPNGDEGTYDNYVGLVSDVGIDGLIMKMNPQVFSVTDYMDLSGIPLDPARMTETSIYNGNVPIYELQESTGSEQGTPVIPAPVPTEPAAAEGAQPASEPAEMVPSVPGTGATGELTPVTKEWVQISPYAISVGDILLFAGSNDAGVVWVVRVGQVDVNQGGAGEAFPGTGVMPGISSGSGPSGSMGGMGAGMGQEEEEALYSLDTVTIASVVPQTTMTIQNTVDELDILKIYTGQEVSVTVDALAGQKFTGSITAISPSGENEGGNSKFTVEVTLDKATDMLPGMRASVSIPLSTVEKVICLPVSALIETGTKTLVYTGYDEETEAFIGSVAVTTGISDGTYVQILSGLEENQTVYYPYYDTLVISDAPERAGFPFG